MKVGDWNSNAGLYSMKSNATSFTDSRTIALNTRNF